jgi:T5orf172 domain
VSRVKDLWHSTVAVPGPDGRAARERRQTAKHPDRGGNPDAKRWLAVWVLPRGREGTKAFARQVDADRYAKKMESDRPAWCLVPKCERDVVTEPPVLLCGDHRDLIVAQETRRRPSVHDPLVYFIRNGSRIKIGWSTNLKARLSSLSLPQSAVLLTIPGGPSEEDFMHQRFRSARWGRTEWFEATSELEAFIEGELAKRAKDRAA